MANFIISGGFFDKYHGSILQVTIRNNTIQVISEHLIEHPEPSLAMRGKGLTGICQEDDHIWACFSNVIVKMDMVHFSIVDVIQDDNFNDLHGLAIHKGKLYVANTGYESIDIVNLENKVLNRIDLLGKDLRNRRPIWNQNEDTKPHLYHISGIAIDESENILVCLVRQQRIINLLSWEWVGPKFKSPVHDLQYFNGDLWWTNVAGIVGKMDSKGETIEYSINGFQHDIGWTRGLSITNSGILVGTAAARESNHDYYKFSTNSPTLQIGAKLCWISYDENLSSSAIELPNSESRKIFSIHRLQDLRTDTICRQSRFEEDFCQLTIDTA
ncbi:MAG: hypothetical protein SAL07_14340 [Oscillatoria sp. PMC 1051.18]|nr:hypothetical protein [Oscillatoria sp. PMC 1050.18]MEC5031073.1 hypothetical protein [Oscillatoria sp. PMC 1051.18]